MSVSGSPGTYVHSIAELRQYLPDSGTNFLWGITGVFLLVSVSLVGSIPSQRFFLVLTNVFTAHRPDILFHGSRK